jgi:hypothetical protein
VPHIETAVCYFSSMLHSHRTLTVREITVTLPGVSHQFLPWCCLTEQVIGTGQSHSEIRNLDIVSYSSMIADSVAMQDFIRPKCFLFLRVVLKSVKIG